MGESLKEYKCHECHRLLSDGQYYTFTIKTHSVNEEKDYDQKVMEVRIHACEACANKILWNRKVVWW